MGEGPIGYFYGLELIVFFGHLPFASFFLFAVFMVVNGLPAILIYCALAPERLTPKSTARRGLIVAIPVVLSTIAAYGVEALVERVDAAAPTQALDLDAASSGDAKRRGFVALSGWEQPRYAAGYGFETTSKYGRTTPHSHLFVPLVKEGWTPASPVEYFVHYVNGGTTAGSDTAPPKRVATGEFGGHLPLYIQWQMERKGVKIARSYAVVESVESDGFGHRADPKRRYMILICGLLLTVPAALCVCFFYGMAGRSMRKQSA
jgi:hypothetical protein